jgi:hypothetical protein
MKSRVEKTARRNRRPTEREFHTEVTKDTEALVIQIDCRAGAPPARFLGSATGAVALQICFLLASCCFSASAIATTPAVCSIDGLDCITSYEVEEEPLQVCDNSPNPWNGLGETASVTGDDAVIPSGDDKDPPQFTATTLDLIALRQPGLVLVFSFPAHSSDSLHGQIRERAPPSLA